MDNALISMFAHYFRFEDLFGDWKWITTDYTGLGKIQYILGQRGLAVLDTSYTDRVEITALVPDGEKGALTKALMEGTNGQVQMEDLENCWFAETEEGLLID